MGLNPSFSFSFSIPALQTFHGHLLPSYDLSASRYLELCVGFASREPSESAVHVRTPVRAQRYCFDCHSRRFIVAHAFLGWLLGQFGGDPRALAFSFSEYGKPAFAEPGGPVKGGPLFTKHIN